MKNIIFNYVDHNLGKTFNTWLRVSHFMWEGMNIIFTSYGDEDGYAYRSEGETSIDLNYYTCSDEQLKIISALAEGRNPFFNFDSLETIKIKNASGKEALKFIECMSTQYERDFFLSSPEQLFLWRTQEEQEEDLKNLLLAKQEEGFLLIKENENLFNNKLDLVLGKDESIGIIHMNDLFKYEESSYDRGYIELSPCRKGIVQCKEIIFTKEVKVFFSETGEEKTFTSTHWGEKEYGELYKFTFPFTIKGSEIHLHSFGNSDGWKDVKYSISNTRKSIVGYFHGYKIMLDLAMKGRSPKEVWASLPIHQKV